MQKCIVFLIGFMGSGKTYHGRRLGNTLGWDFVDIDDLITRKHLLSINEIFAREGESFFRTLEHLVLLDLLKRTEPVIIATGGGTPCFFDHMALMNQRGLTFYLHNPIDKLIAQLLNGQHKRPLLKGKTPEELKDYVESKMDERLKFYQQSRWTINCSPGHHPQEDIVGVLQDQRCL